VLRISDRILVMREGRLMAEFSQSGASEEDILSAATGQAVPPAGPPAESSGAGK
jgi:ABC-type uncharacterized transport system ATPase subunit